MRESHSLALEILDLSKTYKRKVYHELNISSNLPSAFFQEFFLNLMGKCFLQNVQALNKINLAVQRGEILGLLGPNGSGKSTLLKILAGLLLADSGVIKVFGEDLSNRYEKLRQLVNYVPGLLVGGAWLEPTLTVKQNLTLMAEFFEKNSRDIDEILSSLELNEVSDVRVATLSSGMLARLLIGFGFLIDKPIMLFDEPLVGISPEIHETIHQYIKKLKKEGKTIIYTTQNISEVTKLCDRVAILNRGTIVAIDTLEGLKRATGDIDVIEVELNFPSKPIGEIKLMVDEVSDVIFNETSIKILTHNYSSTLPKVINFLISRDLKPKSIKVHEPMIEDVLIKYFKRGN